MNAHKISIGITTVPELEKWARLPEGSTLTWYNILVTQEGLDRHITQHTTTPKGKKARTFRYPKKNSPFNIFLKKIQLFLVKTGKLPPECLGGVKGKSTLQNALLHIQSGKYLYQIDVKDFFPSIKKRMVKDMLIKLNCSPYVSKVIAQLVTYNGSLPQGYCTSPSIANLYLSTFCIDKINDVFSKDSSTVTTWIDDINISSSTEVTFQQQRRVGGILKSAKLQIKRSKEHIRSPNTMKLLTGHSGTNNKIRLPKDKINNIKREIYLCEKHGVKKAAIILSTKEKPVLPEQITKRLLGKINPLQKIDQAKYKIFKEKILMLDQKL